MNLFPKRLSSFGCILGASLTFLSCRSQDEPRVETLPPSEFAQKLKETPGAQVLDVRTEEEFSGQHLDNAVKADWYEPSEFDSKTAKLDKSKPVFVYCMGGSRSKRAAAKLHALGFTQVYDLKGGIVKWNAEGLSGDGPTAKIYGLCPGEYEDLTKTNTYVLVDFYADWCEPCQKMKPYLKTMEGQRKDVTIVRLNADEHRTMYKELDIQELPTLIWYKDGKEIWKHTGFISEQDLKKQLGW